MRRMWMALAVAGLMSGSLYGCWGADREEPVATQMTPEQEAFMQKEMERQKQRQMGLPPTPTAQPAAQPAQ